MVFYEHQSNYQNVTYLNIIKTELTYSYNHLEVSIIVQQNNLFLRIIITTEQLFFHTNYDLQNTNVVVNSKSILFRCYSLYEKLLLSPNLLTRAISHYDFRHCIML